MNFVEVSLNNSLILLLINERVNWSNECGFVKKLYF